MKDAPEYQIFELPKTEWRIEVPKGGLFYIHLQATTRWQRMWFRFIGWGVEKINKT